MALPTGIEQLAGEDNGLLAIRVREDRPVGEAVEDDGAEPDTIRDVNLTQGTQPRVIRHASDHGVDDIFEPG